jgi:hypothetical protein
LFRDPILSVEADGTKVVLVIPASELPRPEDVTLRANGAKERFRRFVRATDLNKIFWRHCSGKEPSFFVFDLTEGPWQFPWELVLDELDTETSKAAFVPVRTVRLQVAVRPWKQMEKLQTVIVEGYPGDVPHRIRPDLEAEGIMDAWEQLDPAIQDRIAKPDRIRLEPAQLSQQLSALNPHIIWYCGHGRSKPKPGLLYASNAWMNAEDFAKAVDAASPPPAVILWACELAEASPDQEPTAPAPQLHRALAARGVQATVAMQSRVNDAVARILAKEFFNALAIGLSIERAAARARHSGDALPFAGLDWASPAVWLARAPARNWSWGSPPGDPLLSRLLGWSSVATIQKVPGPSAFDANALEQASLWESRRRVVVEADTSSEAVISLLANIADASLRKLNLVPLFIRMQRTHPVASIKDWAKEIIAWCEYEALPTPLGKAVQQAMAQPESTPRKLLEIEDTMLVFIDPPEDNDSFWFLSTLADSRRVSPLILVAQTVPADSQFENWAHDSIMGADDMELIRARIASHSATLLALAVLDLPLPDSVLSRIGFSREHFPLGTSFLIETRSGPLLSASAKRLVLEGASSDDLRSAHEACLAMLAERGLTGSDRLRRETLRHSVGARHEQQAIVEAARLIETYFLDGRPAAVAECFENLKPLGKVRDTLDTLGLLRVASSYVSIGKPDRAKLHLRNCHPENPLHRAVILALESEIEKNDGTPGWRERAVSAISGAIEHCRAAQEISSLKERATHQLADYKMNLARLQHYLIHDLPLAEKGYREVLQETADTPGREFLAAAAERNLAECIVSQSPEQPAVKQQAQDLLNDAEARLPKTEQLRAEIAYVRSKLVQPTSPAVEALLRDCIATARETGNGMVEAIADARLFWSAEAFDFARWQRIELALAPYRRHGWAIRTAVNGRIQAARQVAQRGLTQQAIGLLHKNERELAAHPAFDGGTDRDRIAQTFAGLTVLSSDASEITRSQQDAMERPWMTEWLKAKGFATLQDVWTKG